MARREKLPRTLERFEAGLAKLKEAASPEFERKFERDILIEVLTKRFEYTFESAWKTLKELLLAEGIESLSPLGCFKEAFKLDLITPENEQVFPLMVKKRNEIVHIYSAEEAYETYLLVKSSFLPALGALLDRIISRAGKP
ncbi:MAG: nucleotidyltransferase substrate binding protein [Elusimicrobia bacterium]|nr:nucleotidyltransferase substrate binding protein [Elusimicrobiota bacterium]